MLRGNQGSLLYGDVSVMYTSVFKSLASILIGQDSFYLTFHTLSRFLMGLDRRLTRDDNTSCLKRSFIKLRYTTICTGIP